MTADYAARVRTLAARHNREWQLLVEEMDRERTQGPRCTGYAGHPCYDDNCPLHGTKQLGHAEAKEQT